MKSRRRFLLALCIVVDACGGSSTMPNASGYSGRWSGTTSQGRPVSFTISADEKLTSITVGYNFNGCAGEQTYSNLNIDIAPRVTCIPGPCPPDVSSFRAFTYSSGDFNGPFTLINGLFVSTTRAEGSVGFRDYPACGTVLGVSWTATRP